MSVVPKRILVVEDEWMIGEYLVDLLAQAGYETEGPFPNSQQALAFLDANTVDLAILDVSLGKEKSFPIAERLFERSLPFIFLSGYIESDFPSEFRGVKLLAKPVEPRHLFAAIEGALAM